ncbi:MAG: hypothetical protein HDS30_05425 [Bacteroides sp.]|nr:hypothetical protein [Bacteroides sp.]
MAPAEAELSGGIWPDGRKAVYLRMKQPVILFALLIALAAASCGRNDTSRRLDAASELMCDRPDSALSILAAIDTATLSRDARARHALYTICARHKSGEEIDSTFTEMIKLAENRYLNPADMSMESMHTYYIKGLLQLNDSLYANAIINLLFSEERAAESKDDTQLGLIYRNLADAYSAVCDNVTALHYSQKSLDAFTRADARVYIPYAVYDLARMHNNALNFDEALKYGKEAFNLASRDSDSLMIAESISLMGMSYCGKRDYINAKANYELFDSLNLPYIEPADIRLRGISYIYNGDINKAKKYAEYLSEIKSDNRLLLANILEVEHDYENALGILLNLYTETDESLRELYKQDASFILTQHYQLQKTTALKIAHKERKDAALTMIVCALALICMILFVLWRRKRHAFAEISFMQQIKGLSDELEFSHRNSDLLNYQLELANTKNELAKVRSQETLSALKEIFASRSEFLNKICNAYYEGNITTNAKVKVYHEALKHIDELRDDSRMFSKMEGMVNKYFDNLITRLKATPIKLNDDEIKFYIFVIAGMSNCSLGVLFEKKPEAISRTKNRLKSKLAAYDAQHNTNYSKFI